MIRTLLCKAESPGFSLSLSLCLGILGAMPSSVYAGGVPVIDLLPWEIQEKAAEAARRNEEK